MKRYTLYRWLIPLIGVHRAHCKLIRDCERAYRIWKNARSNYAQIALMFRMGKYQWKIGGLIDIAQKELSEAHSNYITIREDLERFEAYWYA